MARKNGLVDSSSLLNNNHNSGGLSHSRGVGVSWGTEFRFLIFQPILEKLEEAAVFVSYSEEKYIYAIEKNALKV